MKKSCIKLVMFLMLILQSCISKEQYHDLTSQEKSFLLYNIGDTFKLKNVSTDEIISLTVNQKEFNYNYIRDTNPIFGASDNYNEEGEYSFSDNSNCYNGTVSIEATENDYFYLSINLGDCFGDFTAFFEPENEIITTFVDDIEYPETYILISPKDYSLFYNKAHGIIKIVDDSNQETLFTITE